jgi:hypothetical protein
MGVPMNNSSGLVEHGAVSRRGVIRANPLNPSSLARSVAISIEQAGNPEFPG